MKKLCAALVAASLIWASGPGPVLAAGRAVAVPKTLSTAVMGGAPVFSALTATGPSPLIAPTLGTTALPLPGFVLPGNPSVSAATPAAAQAAPARAAAAALPAAVKTIAASPSPAVSRAPRGARAATAPPAAQRAPAGKAESVLSGLSRVSAALRAGPKAANAADSKAALDAAFSGSARSETPAPVRAENKTLDAAAAPRLTRAAPETANGAQSPLRVEPAVNAVIEGARDTAAPPAKKEKLPRSFHYYLTGQLLYGIGQESAALIAPLYAYAAQGLEFAVFSQAAALIAIIPGSILGSKLIRKFDSKKVYIVGNLLHAGFFLSVPIMHYLTGSFSPIHFLAFKIVGGLIYGSLRGVAEKEITPRIIGQDNKGQLKKAGSLFYTAFESAEFLSAISIGFMIAAFGLNWTSALMAGVMLASVIPLWFIRFKQKGPVTDTGETGGTERKLPWALYLPFVFAIFVHISMYDFITPFLALEVFHVEALASRFIAAYTLGSLAVAVFMSYLPRLAGKFSERKWTGLGIAATVAFLWGSLLLQMPWLSLVLAGFLGAALTGMMIQWRALYQQRLAIDAQPKVFERLMIASVLMTLIPFAVMQGGLLIAGTSAMVSLLTLVSAGITAGALGYPLVAYLLRRFGRK